MINLKIYTKDKLLERIFLEGHSDYDIKGKDIVCASVSILVYSAYLSLRNLPNLDIEFNDNTEKVELIIKKNNYEVIGELRGITIFLITGLKAIEKDFKDNLKIEYLENY